MSFPVFDEPIPETVPSSWQPRDCDFDEDGASSHLSARHNVDGVSTRSKITQIEIFGYGVIGNVCSVAYGKWGEQRAALIVMTFRFRAKAGLMRYKNAKVSVCFEGQSSGQSPAVRSLYPENNQQVSYPPTTSDECAETPDVRPPEDYTVKGQVWSDEEGEEPNVIEWKLKESQNASGLVLPISVAAIVTFSDPFRAIVEVTATTASKLKLRRFPWSRDDPVLFDGVTFKGAWPEKGGDFAQLTSSELAGYVSRAASSQGDIMTTSTSTAVFRVRGVPFNCTKTALVRSLSLSLGVPEASIHLHSFATSPYRPQKMAAVAFSSRPGILAVPQPKKEWSVKIELPCADKPVDLVCDTHFLGFTVLDQKDLDPSEYTIDIIAVSGLGGHAYGSFKERNGSYMWLEELSSDLRVGNELPDSPEVKARTLIYGHDSRVENSNCFQNIRDLASFLKASLRVIRPGDDCRRPIVFIGHSLGGLLVKELLILLGSEGADEIDKCNLKSVVGALFFGVPNCGMDTSSLLAIIGEQPNREFLASLSVDSQILQQQADMFPTIFNFRDSIIYSFYETCTSGTAVMENGRLTMNGPSVQLVDRESATHSRPWEIGSSYIIAIRRDHSDLVKFERHSHDYEMVLSHIRQLASGSKEVTGRRF